MEEVKVNVAVLKNAIQRVAINDFNQELSKITSVVDLTKEEWSELVSASVATIECYVFRKIRKKDEKRIFTLLLSKLVALSSVKDKLRLTEKGFTDCMRLFPYPEENGYGLDELLTTIKNEKGYSLCYFLNFYQSWKIPKFIKASENRVEQFKAGQTSLTDMWLYANRGSGRLDAFKFLTEEFGLDFFQEFLLSPKYFKDNFAHECFIQDILPHLVKDKVMLQKCCLMYIDCFLRATPKIENKNEADAKTFVDSIFLVCPTYIQVFKAFIPAGANPFLKGEQGVSLYKLIQDWNETLSWLAAGVTTGDGCQLRRTFPGLSSAIQEVLALIEHRKKFEGIKTALCVWKFGNIPFFSQIPRDVIKMVGAYVLPMPENKKPGPC